MHEMKHPVLSCEKVVSDYKDTPLFRPSSPLPSCVNVDAPHYPCLLLLCHLQSACNTLILLHKDDPEHHVILRIYSERPQEILTRLPGG